MRLKDQKRHRNKKTKIKEANQIKKGSGWYSGHSMEASKETTH